MKYPVIDAYNLLCYVLQKWKIIVIAMLIGAIILGSFAFISSSRQKTVKENYSNDNITSILSERQIKEVEVSAKIINNYKCNLESQVDYNNTSMYQSLDANNYLTCTLCYGVDNDNIVTYPVIFENDNLLQIVQSYRALLSSNDVYQRMTNEINNNVLPFYFKEIVSNNFDDANEGAFSITVYANDDDTLSKIVSIIKEEMQKHHDNIETTIGTHYLILTSETKGSGFDPEMATKQRLNLANVSLLEESIEKELEKYSGPELTYLQLLTEENINTISVINYIMMGLILGFAITVIVFVFWYILSDTLRIASSVPVAVLVETELSKKTNGLDKRLFSIRTRGLVKDLDDAISYLLEELKIYSNSANNEKIGLVIDYDIKEKSVELVEKLVNSKERDFVVIEDLLRKSSSLSVLNDCDSVIFIKQVDKSKFKDINLEVDLCNNCDVNIAGSVIIY